VVSLSVGVALLVDPLAARRQYWRHFHRARMEDGSCEHP
jgi:hypothetical protein